MRHFVWRRGNLFEDGKKSRKLRDPNDFVVEGNMCKILIYDFLCKHIATALIDVEDMEKCKIRQWYRIISGNYMYAQSDRPFPRVRLHRFVMDFNEGDPFLDHRNQDGLDCRKENLRVATNSQNQANRGKPIYNTSGEKNIYWHKNRKMWQVSVKQDGTNHYFGSYPDLTEAIEVRNFVVKQMFGEFARS